MRLQSERVGSLHFWALGLFGTGRLAFRPFGPARLGFLAFGLLSIPELLGFLVSWLAGLFVTRWLGC